MQEVTSKLSRIIHARGNKKCKEPSSWKQQKKTKKGKEKKDDKNKTQKMRSWHHKKNKS